MADKKKKVNPNSEVGKATTDESKAAEKVAKAAKGSKKDKKPNIFNRAGKGAKRFYKDFKGESKKIVWPDAQTVLKSTGIVILVVFIVSIIIYGIDSVLNMGITGLESLANPTTTEEVVEDEDTAVDEDTDVTEEDASEEDVTEEDVTDEDVTEEAEEETEADEDATEDATEEDVTEATEE